ncbi:MAG: hypothetical protein EPO31_09725 [Gammaproteobacteria bacterium]|nr:MAG: hypothetical protein EPO31_09725 [Gammaproteobacteria bacterium]
MATQIKRIAPYQAGKVVAVIYFVIGFVFAGPFALIFSLAPADAHGASPGRAFIFLIMPFLYALAGLIFTSIFCMLYNLVASRFGGIEIQLSEIHDD